MKNNEGEILKKFINRMGTKGIVISHDSSNNLNNMVITDGETSILMSRHSLERRSGMCRYMKHIKDDKSNKSHYIEFTYQMWVDKIIEPIIITRLDSMKMKTKIEPIKN